MQLADGSVLGKVGVTDYGLDERAPPERSACPRYYAGPSTGATATVASSKLTVRFSTVPSLFDHTFLIRSTGANLQSQVPTNPS